MSNFVVVEAHKTDRTDLGKCIFTYTTKQKETRKHKRFRQKTVFVKCKKNRQIIIKEEGGKKKTDKKKLM